MPVGPQVRSDAGQHAAEADDLVGDRIQHVKRSTGAGRRGRGQEAVPVVVHAEHVAGDRHRMLCTGVAPSLPVSFIGHVDKLLDRVGGVEDVQRLGHRAGGLPPVEHVIGRVLRRATNVAVVPDAAVLLQRDIPHVERVVVVVPRCRPAHLGCLRTRP